MLEHGRAAFDFAQAIAVPDELRANPELGLDTKRGFELQRGLCRYAFFAAQNVSNLRNRNAHSRRKRSLCQSAALDELLAQNLTGALGGLRRRNTDGENQEEASRMKVRTWDRDCGAA